MTKQEKIERAREKARRKYLAGVLQSVQNLKSTGQKVNAIKLVRVALDVSVTDAKKYYEVE